MRLTTTERFRLAELIAEHAAHYIVNHLYQEKVSGGQTVPHPGL
ncbi:hypothetical protein [Pseudomonas orientalis]